jgi:hypothetical protein
MLRSQLQAGDVLVTWRKGKVNRVCVCEHQCVLSGLLSYVSIPHQLLVRLLRKSAA